MRDLDNRITTIAIPTCNRIDVLMRGLLSFADACRRYDRNLEFVVADDSTRENQLVNRHRLAEVARTGNLPLRYAGAVEKDRFLNRVAATADVPCEVVGTAIKREAMSVYQGGKNYNSILLQTPGTRFLCPDDDVLCDLGRLGEVGDIVAFSTGRDPYQYHFARTRQEALDLVQPVDIDLIGLHEQWLGQPVEALISKSDGSRESDQYRAYRTLRRQQVAAPEHDWIVMTFNGLVGDCAWGAPFGFWGTAMGLLRMEGPSHQRLVRSAAAYQSACTSREIVRSVCRPTISDHSSCIGAIYSLCNQLLLPPEVPWCRGHDAVYGLLLDRCVGNSRFAHLPYTLVHAPEEARRFWPGEICRTAAGYDLSKLMIDLIDEYRPTPELSTADRLRGLAQHLQAIAGHRNGDFFDYACRKSRATAERSISSLQGHLQRCNGVPEFWANDVQRYIEILHRSMKRPDYWTPLDLAVGGDLDLAQSSARSLILRYSDLLYHWPSIVDAAITLREGGEPMAVLL